MCGMHIYKVEVAPRARKIELDELAETISRKALEEALLRYRRTPLIVDVELGEGEEFDGVKAEWVTSGDVCGEHPIGQGLYVLISLPRCLPVRARFGGAEHSLLLDLKRVVVRVFRRTGNRREKIFERELKVSVPEFYLRKPRYTRVEGYRWKIRDLAFRIEKYAKRYGFSYDSLLEELKKIGSAKAPSLYSSRTGSRRKTAPRR